MKMLLPFYWLTMLAGCEPDLGWQTGASTSTNSSWSGGALGRASFSLDGAAVHPIATGAVGGFGVQVAWDASGIAPTVHAVSSQDPAIFTVDTLDGSRAPYYAFALRAVAPGTANLVLVDPSGEEIDHIVVTIRDPDRIALDGDLSAATIVVGVSQKLHVSRFAQGIELGGFGGLAFSLDAMFASTSQDQQTYWLPFSASGDQVFFHATTTGTGNIVVRGGTGYASIELRAIAPSQIDEIDGPSSVEIWNAAEDNVTIEARSQGALAYGTRCAWSAPTGLTIELTALYNSGVGWPGWASQAGGIGESGFVYHFEGPAGTYAATCTMPGGLQKTIDLTIH